MASIKSLQITGDARDKLLTLEEGTFCDLKGTEVSKNRLSKAASAFANTAGGDLYIGIAEVDVSGVKIRQWKGFHDQEAANGHLQSLEQLFPLGAEYSYEFLGAPGSSGLVLHVSVQRTAQISRSRQASLRQTRCSILRGQRPSSA